MNKFQRRKTLALVLLFTGLGAFFIQLAQVFILSDVTTERAYFLIFLHFVFLTVGAIGWFMLLALKEYEQNNPR